MEKKERKTILFTDVGDTIIDEGTEVRNGEDVVQRADCIPGARETYLSLHEDGYFTGNREGAEKHDWEFREEPAGFPKYGEENTDETNCSNDSQHPGDGDPCSG